MTYFIARVSVAFVVVALAAGALPARAQGERVAWHSVTCSGPRVERVYQEALRRFHLGATEEAIRGFQEAARRDPACAMAHWGLSRALRRAGRTAEALEAAARARELAGNADDREQRLIAAWQQLLQAESAPEASRRQQRAAAIRELNLALALYPDDPEIWLLRGEAAESPLRAVPFYLAALSLDPEHPFGRVWKPSAPPPPDVKPGPSRLVPPPPRPPRLLPGLGRLERPIRTRNPDARAYFEQGLRCFHAYVVPSRVPDGAMRCFQYAATLDPECAMAYWGLSFCLGSGDPITSLEAANRALELALESGDDRERRFAAARVLELSGPSKREAFLDALDGALAAYPDDIELWVWRGRLYGDVGGGIYSTGGQVPLDAIPYQLAAHRLQPDHPAPNHELIHGYEALDRPALGWPYTEGFRRSAPNMPHAHHMQAHLAMRLGRWQDAIDATRFSRRKALEGYPELDPSHHIDILIRALAHEGRFREAESEPRAYRDGLPWARLLRLKADASALEAWAQARLASGSADGEYIGALVRLDRNDPEGALPLISRIEARRRRSPNDATLFYRFHETQGRYWVQTGRVDDGLKLLREAAARAVKDSALHAWGGGSYMLEVWGEAALRAGRWSEAEEAFHEALAHEHGSIVGALGMQVVWEQRDDAPPERAREMAAHYAARAREIWKDADAGALERQLERLRALRAPAPQGAGSGSGASPASSSGRPRTVQTSGGTLP